MKTSALTSQLPFEAEDVLRELSARVRVARRSRGLTQPDLAAKAGIGLSTMVAIEKGAGTVQIGYWLSVLWSLDLIEGFSEVVRQLGKEEGDVAMLEAQLPRRVRPGSRP
jgi:DNA-binding XRE family transcriptional regulator